MKGIIYKYTSPDNKVYIGQTTDEEGRRYKFLSNKRYAGKKIDAARIYYGPHNFKYEVLYTIESDNIILIQETLNNKENFFIEYYNSIYRGYNSKSKDCFEDTPYEFFKDIMNTEDYKKYYNMFSTLKQFQNKDGSVNIKKTTNIALDMYIEVKGLKQIKSRLSN